MLPPQPPPPAAATRRRHPPLQPAAATRRAATVEEIKCQPVFHTSLDTLLMILVFCKLDSQKPWQNIEF